MLGDQLPVARVESLGFVEVRLAPVPLASPPSNVRQRSRNPTTIWQKLTCLLKVTRRGIVILQTGVVVKTLGIQSLAKVRLKTERGIGCLPCLFPKGDRWLKTLCQITTRINV